MPFSSQRLVLFLLASLTACADVQHRLPLDLEDGALAIVAVVHEDEIEATAIVGGRSTRFDFPPGSTAIVWRHRAGSFVDSSGRALDEDALSSVTVGTTAGTGCGRCMVPADRAPQLVLPGDECGVPAFATVQVYANDGGPQVTTNEELVATVAARVRLNWPGECGCVDPAPIDPGPADLRVIGSTAPVATDAGTLMPDGTIIGVSLAAFIAIAPSGEVTTRYLREPRGDIRATYTLDEGLLLVTEDPLALDDTSVYELIKPNLDIEPVTGMPSDFDVQIIRRGPQGDLFLAGDSQRFFVPTHIAFRCTPHSPTAYTCVEEQMGIGTCDTQDFNLLSSFRSTTGVLMAFGSFGRVYVRPSGEERWACQQNIALGNFVHNGELYRHQFFEGWAYGGDDLLYLCTVGLTDAGVAASAVRSVRIPVATTLDDLPAPLIVDTVVSFGQMCNDLSEMSVGRRVRSLWGWGGRAIDVEDGRVVADFVGVGQGWGQPTPQLLPEANDVILDWAERDGWALGVGASKSLFRRAPGATSFTSVYTESAPVRGPIRAMAATDPNTIVTFGSTAKRFVAVPGTVEAMTVSVDGYPTSPTAQSDFAVADEANPSRVVVATHDAVRTRCTRRRRTLTPCWDPGSVRSVELLQIDLTEGVIVARHQPFRDDPEVIVAGASIGADAYVFMDSTGRMVSLIDGALEDVTILWDDPNTPVVEEPVELGRWYDLAGRGGAAWAVGVGRVGRVVWTPERQLAVEAYWHERLGSPLTPNDESEFFPLRIDAWCADRAIIQSIQAFAMPGAPTASMQAWTLETAGDACASGSPMALCPLANNDRQQSFSRSFEFMRPMGTIRTADGRVRTLYDDGTVETRGQPRALTPFSYVGGFAVSDNLALIGGEGERVVAVMSE